MVNIITDPAALNWGFFSEYFQDVICSYEMCQPGISTLNVLFSYQPVECRHVSSVCKTQLSLHGKGKNIAVSFIFNYWGQLWQNKMQIHNQCFRIASFLFLIDPATIFTQYFLFDSMLDRLLPLGPAYSAIIKILNVKYSNGWHSDCHLVCITSLHREHIASVTSYN